MQLEVRRWKLLAMFMLIVARILRGHLHILGGAYDGGGYTVGLQAHVICCSAR